MFTMKVLTKGKQNTMFFAAYLNTQAIKQREMIF